MAAWTVVLPFMQGNDWQVPGEALDLAPAQSVFLELGGFIELAFVEQVPPVPPPIEIAPKKTPAKTPLPKPVTPQPAPAPVPKEEKKS